MRTPVGITAVVDSFVVTRERYAGVTLSRWRTADADGATFAANAERSDGLRRRRDSPVPERAS